MVAASGISALSLWRKVLVLFPVWPPVLVAPRAPGPCSEWFDNAWLKSKGFSADVCCWRNHTDCWQDGYDYGICCSDYDTSHYQHGLQSLGHVLLAPELLAKAALPLGDSLRTFGGASSINGTALDGRLPPLVGLEGELAAPDYATPRDFFIAVAPAAALAAQRASEADSSHGSVSVLFIMTAPGNFARRQAIRQTWLQSLGWPGAERLRYAFVAGAPDATTRERIPGVAIELREEQEEFADLLVLPSLQDIYWGWEHTAKTFLALIAVLARVPDASHFACLHDDVYVHLPRLAELLDARRQFQVENSGNGGFPAGLYLGNAYLGHDFAGHSSTDGSDYEAMHGHRKMPPVMKGGLWVVDSQLARWVAAMLSGPAALLPWRLWPSDDDSVGLVFGELDILREHALRHGSEWFDWRLGDRCDGDRLVVAHDLKTPRELFEMWVRHLAFGNPCHGVEGAGLVRLTSRPEDFVFAEP
ncbi:unnamed protein product [Polarella glacialis]|uniref:Hexosyltransferase n=1 Tax=Polarella glacialis TaxID=89957 RepID=A0A813E781_POLGL|nr:unnamed protein product [Polarella glacialis]